MIRVTVQLPTDHPFGSISLEAICKNLLYVIEDTLECDRNSILLSVVPYEYASVEGMIVDISIYDRANAQIRRLAEALRVFFSPETGTTPTIKVFGGSFVPVTCLILDASTGISFPMHIK